jgi:hypothetical protein
MKIPESFISAEIRYQRKLEIFFRSVYDDSRLISHGLAHHMRVWENAKEILSLDNLRYLANDNSFVEKLIMACFIHDTGMSVDPGIIHGIHSSAIFKRFLAENNLNFTDYQDVIQAVEDHDKKQYYPSYRINDLTDILSVADDLDAFGFNGIFRYAEIYLERNTSFEKLGHMVLENAAGRFGNFNRRFWTDITFYKKHEKNYKILRRFFTGYNSQLSGYAFNKTYSGYCGIIEMISEGLLKLYSPGDIFQNNKEIINDPIIKWYISGLEGEVSDG